MRILLPSGTPAELALPPSGREPLLGLALCPDIMGLRPLFDSLCARLADEQGWAVCAVEPFPGRQEETLEERLGKPLSEGLLDDLVAAAERTRCARTAVLGFCMGGMAVFQAAGLARFDRAVSFYGMIRLPEPWQGPAAVEPLDAIRESGASPTLAIVAGMDRWAPAADVDALRAVGDGVGVVVYPDADHGFVHDPARPAHRPDDAADAWRRAVAFIDTVNDTVSEPGD